MIKFKTLILIFCLLVVATTSAIFGFKTSQKDFGLKGTSVETPKDDISVVPLNKSELDPLQEKIKLDNAIIELLPSTEEEYMRATVSNSDPLRLDYLWENECWMLNEQKDKRDCIETKAFKISPNGIARRKNDCLFIQTKVGEKKFCDPKYDYMIASDGVEYPFSFYGVLPNGLIMVREQSYESSSVHLINPIDGNVAKVYASLIPYTFESSPMIVSYYLNQADGPDGLIQIYTYKNKVLQEMYRLNPQKYHGLISPRLLDDKTFIWKTDDNYSSYPKNSYVRMNILDLLES